MSKLVNVLHAGKISYSHGLKLQKLIANLHKTNETNADTIILLEHPPVYTVGIRSNDYTVEDEIKLKQTGAEYFRTNRGGLITFHGPGQLVAYPILNLKHYKTSIKWYVCNIEKTVIDLCSKFGLPAETSPHTGVWIGDNKVCAIGIHGSRFITTHGLAINCCNDLEWFTHIVPCGIKDKGVTSLSKELHRVVKVEEVVPLFLESFGSLFECICTSYTEERTKEIILETA